MKQLIVPLITLFLLGCGGSDNAESDTNGGLVTDPPTSTPEMVFDEAKFDEVVLG
mgnify:CR=1 FL=1